MTTTLEKSVFIQATTEEIDKVTLDGNRFPEWYAGVQTASPDPHYPEIGSATHVEYKAAGIIFNMSMTVENIVYGQLLTLKMDGMITGTSHWVYTPEENGTLLTCTFRYQLPGGGLGQLANKLIVERMNSDNLEKSLQALKKVVESG